MTHEVEAGPASVQGLGIVGVDADQGTQGVVGMLQGSQLLVCGAQLQQRICVLWLQLQGALKVCNCSVIGACVRQAQGSVKSPVYRTR